jgi:L-lysine 2,3-aminomutase
LKNQQPNWQHELAQSFSDIEGLCHYLHIAPAELPISMQAAKDFPFRVPKGYAALMEKGNPNDPLLRQVLPVNDEQIKFPGYSHDPVGDLEAVSETGILHKYYGRALFITTGGCAINCRYCFRRNFPYAEIQLSRQKEDAAIRYIINNPSISEVILSGGDPLLLNDSRFTALIQKLSSIDSLQRIRIHSRIPIVLPERINAALIAGLSSARQQVIVVVHSNHANEISPAVAQACTTLSKSNITLLNQSVLLKGVNDTAEQLCHLSEILFSIKVMPYYLHILDKANGTGHFEVSEAEAVKIFHTLQEKLPGYLVPKLVNEQAGAPSKTMILV